jgi:hypothetical protein
MDIKKSDRSLTVQRKAGKGSLREPERRKGWMTNNWERRKECKWKKGKDRGPEVGREEGMQEEERKGWMTQIGRGGRNTRGGKERMDDTDWERRKEYKRRKGKDG